MTEQIIGACIEVHQILGPGLLESVYEDALCCELGLRGIRFVRQLAVPVHYKDLLLATSHRLDLVVADRVILELKSIARIDSIHVAQVITYLRLTNYPVGLLINFNVPVLTRGIRRLTKK